MNKWKITARWICIACVLGTAGNLFAQTDHFIENQRYVVGINDFSWGDTYVGKYTSGNGLILEEHIVGTTTNEVKLTIESLQIGSNTNSGNFVDIYKGGQLDINGSLTILNTNGGEGLTIHNQGTLFVKSDFDAAMGGFNYDAGGRLHVGGSVTNLDNVEGGLNFTLTGAGATWDLASTNLIIGASSDANSVSISNNAQMGVANLLIGSGGTNNLFLITDGGRAVIQDVINIQTENFLRVTNGGWLEVGMDFDASMAGFELQEGGGLEAHRNLAIGGITNGVHVVLDGENALWDRGVQNLEIGSSTNSKNNSLVVENGARALGNQLNLGSLSDGNTLDITTGGEVATDHFIIGSTNTKDNAIWITDGGNLILEGSGSYINASNSFRVVDGGRLTVKTNFVDAIGWHENASFHWGNGGILEVHREAPIFSGRVVNGKYIEYGTLFLQDGENLILNGSNAAWSAAAHNLHIGDLSSGNSLIVTNGGHAIVKSMSIGDFVHGGHSNSVLITGAGSDIHSLGDVEVGGRFLAGEWIDGGSNNTLRIEDGGTLVSDGAFRFGGNNNTFSIGGASSQFSVAGDMLFGGSSQLIQISNGATLTNNTFSMAGDDNTLLVDGVGSVLAATGDMTFDGSDLLIGITDGGTLTGGGAFSMSGDDNKLYISGSNSLLSTAGDLTVNGSNSLVEVLSEGQLEVGGSLGLAGQDGRTFIGANSTAQIAGDISIGGDDYILRVEEGGRLLGGGELRNSSNSSGIELAQGALIKVTNYYQAAGASLNYEIDQSPTNPGLLQVTDTAEFEADAKIGFYSGVTNLTLTTTYTNLLVKSETLIVGGHTNATSEHLATFLDTSGTSLIDFLLMVQDDNILAILNRRALAGSAGFTDGSMMWDIAEEIDRLSLNGNENAAKQIEILSNMGSDQERALQLNQLYAYQLPTYMHNQGVFGGIDQVRARGLSAHEPARSKPKGAAGPHAEDQGLQGWAKVYGSFGNRSKDADSGSGFEDGYDAQTYGTVIGLDQAFGDWLFGLAGGYAGSTLDGDNGDESDATTGYGILYANYGTKEWFGDLILSYGLTDMDNTSGTDMDVTSSTEASQTMFYIGGGYQFEDKPSGALLRPLFGLQVSQFDQDAYTEESPNALAKDVEAYDRLSAQSTLGVSLIFPKAGSKVDMELQLRTYWLHEFNDDEENVGYTLIDSGLPGQFVLRSPDADVGQIGMGFVTKGKNGWQLRADIDLQLSETFTSTTLSGALLYEF